MLSLIHIYLMYAFRNVGGFYLSEHRVGDRNQALSVVSKAQQREEARFVMNELCNTVSYTHLAPAAEATTAAAPAAEEGGIHKEIKVDVYKRQR